MDAASLAEENAALKALLARSQSDLAEHQAALAASEEARRRLEIIIDDLRREKFGSKSEKLTLDQFNLPLEDVEIAQGVLDAAQEKAAVTIKGKSARAATSSPKPTRTVVRYSIASNTPASGSITTGV